MEDLIRGLAQFKTTVFPELSGLFQELAYVQSPTTLFIACSDSRVVPELLTQQQPGRLFVVRNAGNIVPSYGPEPGGVSAAIEYAVAVLGVKDIVICGHSNCGAMSAIAMAETVAHLPAVAAWLRHADAAKAVNATGVYETAQERVEELVRQNVKVQLNNIRTHPSVAVALETERIALHGWVYDIETGRVDILNYETGRFEALDPKQFCG